MRRSGWWFLAISLSPASRQARFFSARVCLFFAFSAFAPAARAQTTSTIEGSVTDRQGLAVAGAEVRLDGDTVVFDKTTVTDGNGKYQLAAVPAGTYKLTVSRSGFATQVFRDLEITLNRILTFNVSLEVGTVQQKIEVSAEIPLLDASSSAQSSTIVPQQIVGMPINGRNYLDLLQLVPGVALNRQADIGSDNAVPILGERGNNTTFLIDGLNNRDDLNGGAATQFNQETIAEFQVITAGYKAEFGNASGGVVNVITRSGGNGTHGTASLFHRNNAFDSSDVPGLDAPFLHRWDYSLAMGGPVVKDKIFWFGSGERIDEARHLNFVFPPGSEQVPAVVAAENRFNQPSTEKQTRFFAKFDENWRRHRFTEQINYNNIHVANFLPLSASTSLPSTRTNSGNRNLLFGLSDTATLGNSANPWILTVRGQYRRQPSSTGPAHPDAGPNTSFNVFSDYRTGLIFGDVTQLSFGAVLTPGNIDQLYGNFGASLAKTWNRHTFKWGWDFVRTQVDGLENNVQNNQLFATIADFSQFGPIDSGFFLLLNEGGLTPQSNQIHLRNNYDGLFLQDDWKVLPKLTLNLGLRWDYDSRFNKADKVSPRLGFAWQVTPKTVVRSGWGYFYDHFRLGLARDIPEFGGADIRVTQPLSYPRLFFGVPTVAPALFGLCLSQTETDAQLLVQPDTCFPPTTPPNPPQPFPPLPSQFGVDHLNKVVAAGHLPIPGNTVVTVNNVQQLSGLTPQEFADQASLSIGKQPGYFFWGPFGALSNNIFQSGVFPVTVDASFDTPYTRSFTFGVQRQFTNDLVVSLDYYHKDIKNILGVRQTNLAFDARVNGSSAVFENGYGPWYSGVYNAGILSFDKRFSRRFTIGGSYTWASENDDALCSNFDTSITGPCYPTDSFRGMTTVVTDPGQGLCAGGATNANGSFIACNGNFVPKAGIFYDGAKLDKGPSDLALRHTLETHGLIELPWKIEISSLFRVQSGFRYTQLASAPLDQDGNGNFNGRDLKTGRNQFNAPHFLNMDIRFAKTFALGERVRIRGHFELFNLFNSANPAAVQRQEGGVGVQPFGAVSQFLPGREGQFGLRIEF
jgi:outer membrane receptor protein involved in Fe transport